MKPSGARQCPLATHGHNDQIYTFSPPFSAFRRKDQMIYVVWRERFFLQRFAQNRKWPKQNEHPK
jgi:hypothetical protein